MWTLFSSFITTQKEVKLNVTQQSELQTISKKTVNAKGKSIDLARYSSNRFVWIVHCNCRAELEAAQLLSQDPEAYQNFTPIK